MPLTERNQNIPRKTPPQTQSTPSSQSKLPRRVPTPNSAPTTIKWSSSVTDRVASAEKTSNENKNSNRQRDLHVSRIRKAQQANTAVANKPLPGEKPLPSRPIARLSNSLSPSKDSRGLIDARESPLHIMSFTGEKHIWPSLTPLSASSVSPPASNDFADTSYTDSSPPVSPSRAARESLMAAATTLTNVITGGPPNREAKGLASSQSSASSYASANESSSPSQPDVNTSLDIKKTRSDEFTSTPESATQRQDPTDLPTRKASLRQRISDGNLVSPSTGSTHGFIAFTDFTRVQDSSTVQFDSRPHSPSPASFSRPRPGSRSSTDSRSIWTASRIPVPDTKKATVIDVKRHRLSGQSTSSQAAAPTFGSRRLASPEALKILENGKMHRQLKRMAPDQNLAGALLERTWTPDSNKSAFTADTPPLSHSFDNSPDGLLAPNSPENHGTDYSASDSAWSNQERESFEHGIASRTSQLHEVAQDSGYDAMHYDSRPPPTSAFTTPLQTIPSQAVLPTYEAYKSEEGRTELSRALSCLEGGISSQNPDVDQQTLIQMFGHLKCGMESHKKTSTTLSQNAAAAEKYLAQHSSVDTEANGAENEAGPEMVNDKCEETTAETRTRSNCAEQRKQTMISKWSDSTPSDKDLSPAAEGLTSQEPLPSITQSANMIGEIKAAIDEATCTNHAPRIPSRINTTAPTRTEPKPSDESARAPKASVLSRRISSPTLGNARNAKKKPGSVRVAREGIQKAVPSFSRTTMAAESKRATRKPTLHSKTMIIPEHEVRGRTSPTSASRSEQADGVSTKTPRSRSRSRLMLDKINDLLSGKRDRKSEDIPPVPRIQGHNLNGYVPIKSHPVELPAELSPTRTPRLPKMPSLSPSIQTPLSTASPATTKADDSPMTDSFSDAQSVQSLSDHIISKAQRQTNPHRKERLLNFAKVLNDSLISAREAQISAETAQHAAKCAQMSYEMTQQSLAMLQRMAANMTRASHNRKV